MSTIKTRMFKNPILITGGAGFLGSHMAAFCLEKKIDIVVIDNLSNSDLTNLKKLEKYFNVTIPFFEIDIRDHKSLETFFKKYDFDSVVHFAGLKSVSDSVSNPDLYYENNVLGSKNLIDCIKKKSTIQTVIFSSSATVYGEPIYLPIDETHPIQPKNPYGKTKADVEQLFMNDVFFKKISTKIFRYFNPIGSYMGIIGENPRGTPNNLMPYILGVINKKYKFLKIFGNDYNTPDGTGIRDYIHVMDLVEAHWLGIQCNDTGCHIYNIGCGKGYSVKEVLKTIELLQNEQIQYQIQSRRDGDIAISYSDVKKINDSFNWVAKYNLEDMCSDSLKYNGMNK